MIHAEAEEAFKVWSYGWELFLVKSEA